MAIIDADGLFSGDRLRRCSNAAKLHWPRLFLASDGFGRLELNYHKIASRAYAAFVPEPTEVEIFAYLREYVDNHLLFVYGGDGQLWGQWDTPAEFLPRYKTAIDRRSQIPPEPAFSDWKRSYRAESKLFPKSLGNIPETFPYGGGVGGVKGLGLVSENTYASADARVTETGALKLLPTAVEIAPSVILNRSARADLTAQQEMWFTDWWANYWLRKAKVAARRAFGNKVKTEARFDKIMTATRLQSTEMLSREPRHRPHGASWLNGDRFDDEQAQVNLSGVSAGTQPAVSEIQRLVEEQALLRARGRDELRHR